MIVFYLGAFIAGLLLGVAVMLFGIERRKATASQQPERKIRPSLPLVAAFAIAFGLAGYSLSRVAATFGALVVAIAIGTAVAVLMRWLVVEAAEGAFE